ncbi:MAG TPA: SDR family oxidoreductase [Actinomycetota bacterium]|nr:SDR family oxidoreductase [Actinomycetota bacterium]
MAGTPAATWAQPALLGQTVVVLGGSSGIGLETARQAREAGARVIITGRNEVRLRDAARQVHAEEAVAFDAADADRLEQFFADLPGPIDHVMVTAGGPHYLAMDEMDLAEARRAFDERLTVTLGVGLYSRGRMRPGGSLVFVGGTGTRRPAVGLTVAAALPALVANLALELAPTRVNLVAPGFVDTPLSATLLGDRFEARRDSLRSALPIGRLVGPADVAALAIHMMSNEALTGATFEIDGGQRILPT